MKELVANGFYSDKQAKMKNTTKEFMHHSFVKIFAFKRSFFDLSNAMENSSHSI